MYYEEFMRKRITQLRMQNNLSEMELSLKLGHGKTYINKIVMGQSFPSVPELLYIIDYFGLTPKEFFDDNVEIPMKVKEILNLISQLNDNDLDIILSVADRVYKSKDKS